MRRVLASLGLVMTGCGLASNETQEERARFALPRVTADVPASEADADAWTIVTSPSLPWLFEDGIDLAEAQGGGAFIAGWPYRGGDVITPQHDFGLLKIGANGLPDPSFGNGGLAISFADSRHGVARDVLATADGEIVCGFVFDGGGTRFAVARLDLLGRPLGPPHGGNAQGEMLMQEQGACTAVAAAPDGAYVVGGDMMTGDHVFLRFRSDGSPDTTFGDGGRTEVPDFFIDGSCCVRDISIASDGSIFVSTSPAGYVFKLTPDGIHDLTWGVGGYLDVSGAAESLQLDGDGFVVAGFRDTYQPFIERYFLDGSVDETFGDGGIIAFDRFGEFTDTDLDGDGLIAVGRTDVGGLLLRIDASGQIDPEVGVMDFPLDNATEFNAVEVFSDGNIVISGYDPLLFRILRESAASVPSD